MSDDIRSALLSEGDATVRRANESLENVPAPADRSDPDSSSAQPAADTDIEHVSRTATSPSVEAEPQDDPQAPGKVQ